MPFVDLAGVRLWYEDSGGTGPAAVFLHAASGTCESWLAQIPVFSEAGYRCIAYDRRYWGRSTVDPAGEQPGFATDDLRPWSSVSVWPAFISLAPRPAAVRPLIMRLATLTVCAA